MREQEKLEEESKEDRRNRILRRKQMISKNHIYNENKIRRFEVKFNYELSNVLLITFLGKLDILSCRIFRKPLVESEDDLSQYDNYKSSKIFKQKFSKIRRTISDFFDPYQNLESPLNHKVRSSVRNYFVEYYYSNHPFLIRPIDVAYRYNNSGKTPSEKDKKGIEKMWERDPESKRRSFNIDTPESGYSSYDEYPSFYDQKFMKKERGRHERHQESLSSNQIFLTLYTGLTLFF
jgi:hypothetical protein